MTPSEIAETLINGNISDVRVAICGSNTNKRSGDAYAAAVLALDVAGELAPMLGHYSDGENYAAAIARLRRCLTGGT